MKRLSLYLFLVLFTLPTPSQADDIRDFQIEGIGLGDSLLNHFSEEEINNFNMEKFPKDNFVVLSVESNKFKDYDAMQFNFKPNDNTYLLHGVIGIIAFPNNIKNCYKKMDEVVNDLSLILKNFYKTDSGRLENPVGADPYGGTYDLVSFAKRKGKKSKRIQISCNDWSEKSGITDSVKIEIFSEELAYFVDYIAYK